MDRKLVKQTGRNIVFEENTDVISYQDIVFFSLAEGGAMGCPGEVLIAAKKEGIVKWFSLNTMTTPSKELLEIFPPLKTFDCGLFGNASGIQKGWNHVDLGFGNHLLVRDDHYKDFTNAVSKLHFKSPAEIYANWIGVAQLLLLN